MALYHCLGIADSRPATAAQQTSRYFLTYRQRSSSSSSPFVATITSNKPHIQSATVAPIILDPDFNPFLSNSGYESAGVEMGEIFDGYSTACSDSGLVAPHLHTFPRSLSNSSNMSAASSLDSMDGYGGSMGDEDWIHHYNLSVS